MLEISLISINENTNTMYVKMDETKAHLLSASKSYKRIIRKSSVSYKCDVRKKIRRTIIGITSTV